MKAKSKLTEKQKNALIEKAKKNNVEYRKKVQHLVDSNKKLLEVPEDTVYIGAGEVEFAVFIAYGVLTFDITFVGSPSGTLSFSGNDWGLGLGAWEGEGAAIFSLPPNELVGFGSAIVIVGGADENAFTVNCYDSNGTYYGNITGIADGAGVVAATIGGTYTWG